MGRLETAFETAAAQLAPRKDSIIVAVKCTVPPADGRLQYEIPETLQREAAYDPHSVYLGAS
jgi:hypothetical protein